MTENKDKIEKMQKEIEKSLSQPCKDDKRFDAIVMGNEDMLKPCEPINVPSQEELKGFVPESVKNGIIDKLSIEMSKPLYMTPQEIKNDPYFSKIMSVPEEEIQKECDKKIKDLLRPLHEKELEKLETYNDTEEEIKKDALEWIKNNSEEKPPSITKTLHENYKKLSKTKEFKRIHEISVRIDENEKQKIEERAALFGFKNVSDYIRFVSMNSFLMAGIDPTNREIDKSVQQKKEIEDLLAKTMKTVQEYFNKEK